MTTAVLTKKEQDDVNYKELLGRLNVFEVQVNTFAGYITRDDVETDQARTAGSYKVIDPKRISVFTNTRVYVKRECLKDGVSFLGGYGVADDRVEPLALRLSAMGRRFMEEKETFVKNYEDYVQQWADENPSIAKKILDGAPKKDYVKGQINFGIRVFKVLPQSEKMIACGGTDVIKSDMASLSDQLIREISQDVKDNWTPTGTPTTKTVLFLKRILTKLQSLSFLNSRVSQIADYVEDTLKKLPTSGKIEGHDYLVFAGMMAILADEKRLAKEQLVITLQPEPVPSEVKVAVEKIVEAKAESVSAGEATAPEVKVAKVTKPKSTKAKATKAPVEVEPAVVVVKDEPLPVEPIAADDTQVSDVVEPVRVSVDSILEEHANPNGNVVPSQEQEQPSYAW